MSLLRPLVRLGIAALLLGAIASAIAASIAKRRLESRGEAADNDVELVTIFDELAFTSTAPALRRLTALTWYGGGTVDLRGATLDPDGCVIELRAAFGGMRLVVPPSWRIENELRAFVGGAGDARDIGSVPTAGPTVRVRGFAVFGGVGIVSSAPDLDRPADPVPA